MSTGGPWPRDRADDSSSGAALDLASTQDAETAALASGSTFLVTRRDGNIAPAGARELGLFQRDTRYLSHYELVLLGGDVVYLSAETPADAIHEIDLMLSAGQVHANLDDPQNFLHVRRRQLVDDGGLYELIEMTSFLSRRLELEARVSFAADFADIFEVRGAVRRRRGQRLPAEVGPDGADLRYRGLDGVDYATHLRFLPSPAVITDSQAVFRLVLAPRETCTISISVTPHAGLAPMRHRRRSFSEEARRLFIQQEAFRDECARFVCDDNGVQRALERATGDLFAMQLRDAEDTIVAAGIPWFCCPFGRDALITAYEALLLNPSIARTSLITLARHQGQRDDPFTEEEPGRIMHELRYGEMTRTGELPHRPYYGSVDATPLFVIVAEAYHKATSDLGTMERLKPAILAALAWIDRRTQSGRTLLTYHRRSPQGLDNQGWKDSRKAVCFPDGALAEPPIALCEVQGYCVDAYRRAARLLDALGEGARARTYAQQAEDLRELVEDRMWMPRLNRYAYAVDGAGRLVDSVVSNLGHLLWSRVPSPERAAATGDLLLDDASFSGFGIRTLASGVPAYNPLSYHNGTVWPHDNAIIAKGLANYFLPQHVGRIFEGMLAALDTLRDRRLPELFCGMEREDGRLVRYPVACNPQAWASASLFLFVQAVLGIHVDAPHARLVIRDPHMPPRLSDLTIERLALGRSRVTARFRRVGRRCYVEQLDVEGSPVQTVVELH